MVVARECGRITPQDLPEALRAAKSEAQSLLETISVYMEKESFDLAMLRFRSLRTPTEMSFIFLSGTAQYKDGIKRS